MTFKSQSIHCPELYLLQNFHGDPFSAFYITLLTERETDLYIQTHARHYITSLAEGLSVDAAEVDFHRGASNE